MKNKTLFLTVIAAAFIAAAVVTSNTGCTLKLASGGAYAPAQFQVTTDTNGVAVTNSVATAAPDLAFYAADQAYNLAYTTVDATFKWERENRAQLFKLDPAIKHTLDKIRPVALNIHERWAVARKAYEANPIPANLTTFQTITAQIQALLPAVAAAQALTVPTNSATP